MERTEYRVRVPWSHSGREWTAIVRSWERSKRGWLGAEDPLLSPRGCWRRPSAARGDRTARGYRGPMLQFLRYGTVGGRTAHRRACRHDRRSSAGDSSPSQTRDRQVALVSQPWQWRRGRGASRGQQFLLEPALRDRRKHGVRGLDGPGSFQKPGPKALRQPGSARSFAVSRQPFASPQECRRSSHSRPPVGLSARAVCGGAARSGIGATP